MKEKLKIAVIFNEPDPSIYDKKSVDLSNVDFDPYFEIDDTTPLEEYENIAQIFRDKGYDAVTLNLFDSLDKLISFNEEYKPDVVFNFIEIFHDNSRLEMNVAGVMDLLGITYTGASTLTLANCQNKLFTKKLLKSEGIRTPDFILFTEESTNFDHQLNFPLIVKPVYEDASGGIENASIVSNQAELEDRVKYVFSEFKMPALVEEFINGRELNCAVLGDKEIMALPISEIDFSAMPPHLYNIVSFQAKWEPGHEAYHKTVPICPAELPKEIEEEAKDMALKAFRIMECRDYARVDIRLSKDNKLYVLEVNPNPDLTEGVGLMRSADAMGLTYEDTLEKIVKFAIERIPKH